MDPKADRAPVPPRAILFSLISFAVPAALPLVRPDLAESFEILTWLFALIPAFLLAYYKGWRGSATALAAGMAVLSLTQATAPLLSRGAGDWSFLLGLLAVFILISLGFGSLAEMLHQARAQASQLALTDDLTALPNRRHLNLVLEREFAAAERGRPLTVVLFDLDCFKDFNERHGEEAGNEALRSFGRVLNETTRRMNLSARYGGEEFLSIVSADGVDGTLVFVNRVQQALKEASPGLAPVTVSAGVAAYQRGMRSADDLIRAADLALARAKQMGGGGVGVHENVSTWSADVQEYLRRAREHLRQAEGPGRKES